MQTILDELNYNAKRMWVTGMWVSIDEQTLGFKGRHGMKLRISYKREGDGFQCDAVCDSGYTFSFCFRYGDAPTLPQKFKYLDLSPTARRVVWLALRLSNDWTSIFMDNLFNSRKLFTALYLGKCLAHGVARVSGRGLCAHVVQKEETNKKRAELLRGTTRAARLINCKECPDLLSVSVYDTKPVNMLSTAESDVRWVEKRRKVWSAAHKKVLDIGYLRLNFIDDYNNGMNYVEMADQLRNQYRPDHWMRNRKWWWAFLIWSIGVSATNAWKLYDVMYDTAQGNGENLPTKWTHRDFLVQLAYDLIFPQQTKLHLAELRDQDARSAVSSVSKTGSLDSFKNMTAPSLKYYDFSCNSGVDYFLKEVTPERLTPQKMEKGYFPKRLDGLRHATAECSNNRTVRCQYCYFLWNSTHKKEQAFVVMKQNRQGVRRCLVCNVNL